MEREMKQAPLNSVLCGVFVVLVLFLSIGGAIAAVSNDFEPVIAPNTLSITMSTWLLIFGIVVWVMLLIWMVEWFTLPDSARQVTVPLVAPTMEKEVPLFWIRTAVVFFLTMPWLIIGQILVLHPKVATTTAAGWVYGLSIAIVIVLYVLLGIMLWSVVYQLNHLGDAVAKNRQHLESSTRKFVPGGARGAFSWYY